MLVPKAEVWLIFSTTFVDSTYRNDELLLPSAGQDIWFVSMLDIRQDGTLNLWSRASILQNQKVTGTSLAQGDCISPSNPHSSSQVDVIFTSLSTEW